MEALLLFFDIGVLMAAFMWAIGQNGAGGPSTGLFRFKDRLPGKPGPAEQPPHGKARPRVTR